MLNLTLTALFLAALAADAADQPSPTPAEARKLVERSLPFLEKESVAWLETKKCSTCHHVPMLLWTHYEAKQRGFAVNDKAVQEAETKVLAQYLEHPTFQPTGQDKGFFEKELGFGSIYLSLGLKANPAPSEEAKGALAKLTANFFKHQNENGSWTTKQNQPPLVDGHDASTMYVLLASADGGPAGANREAWERALKWLKDTPARSDNQPLALSLMLAAKCGVKEDAERLTGVLRGQQREDGGWGQTKDLASDAVATGQSLYALGAAGVNADDAAVRRAWAFLAKTQQADGSWLVHTRNKNGHDPIIGYYGTGWATLGVLQTLPK